MVIALGNPPLRVDVLTSISGVSFERARLTFPPHGCRTASSFACPPGLRL
jgi:hypothetical protein